MKDFALRIASRKSDLARLQSLQVGEAIGKVFKNTKIEFCFSDSLGDINQHDPLWRMPEKGVFTSDLTKGLVEKKWDAVVHSWKDLPTEENVHTEIVATLPRADARDLLLLPMSVSLGSALITILSSSPRREFNIKSFLADHWPKQNASTDFNFVPVRGNISTRLKKMFAEKNQALIIAKAAVDRILSSTQTEFEQVRRDFSAALENCRFMILPLSLNPTAAAQGALAIEVRRDDSCCREIFAAINDTETFSLVSEERKILQATGGGCHQKLGISLSPHRFGSLLSVRGDRPGAYKFIPRNQRAEAPASVKACAPDSFFSRQRMKCEIPSTRGIYVSHPDAIPENWNSDDLTSKLIWSSGLSTWKSLADKGHWVNGTDDSLGEESPSQSLKSFFPASAGKVWTKLTHENSEAVSSPDFVNLATYQLIDKNTDPSNLKGFEYFYWRSFSQFKKALELCPEIINAQHSCGLGHSFDLISQEVQKHGLKNSLSAFLNIDEWRSYYGIT